jgi:iron complex transport system ATP-binding protein
MSLVATDISFSYGSRFRLDGASLRADDGKFVGIIGANGSGKTTLLKIITGLLPRSGGGIMLDSEPIEAFSADRRARHLAYVPQSYKPAFEFTVEQMVLLGRMPYRAAYGGFESEEDLAAADEAITLMDLERLRQEPVTKLSGGELQRVMIAKALAQGAGTIVLDEPNTHLDISHQQVVLATLRQRLRDRSLAIIASIHDLNLASIFCDSLVVMASGRTLRQGSPAEVLTDEMLRRTFGIGLDVEPGVYGNAPAVRYRYQGGGGSSGR